jgi:hypothetical protein
LSAFSEGDSQLKVRHLQVEGRNFAEAGFRAPALHNVKAGLVANPTLDAGGAAGGG